ncbi:MAG: hypothetical protein AB7U82_02835 [Blastocatellales bacterium]
MYKRASFTLKSVEQHLSGWLKTYSSDPVSRQAEELPLRRDMATLLTFVRDNKVVGIQGTGNMPLKAVREVTSRFVNPPALEDKIGDKTYKLRSEEHLWPLHYLHILADVGGLLKAASARRWTLTRQGERFLEADPLLQTAFLLAVWWRRVNWLVAYPFEGMGDALPPYFNRATLAVLRSLPIGADVPFDEFADSLIGVTKLTWTAQDSTMATTLLRGSIKRMVISVLEDFGAVECSYREEHLGKGTITQLDAFKITPMGSALLDAAIMAAT